MKALQSIRQQALLEFMSKCQNPFWMDSPLLVLPDIITVLARWEKWSQFTSFFHYLPVFSPSFFSKNTKSKLQHLTQRYKKKYMRLGKSLAKSKVYAELAEYLFVV